MSNISKTEQQATAMLDRLIALDFQTVEAYYDMGSIISSMQHGKLYDAIGYYSMTHLIEEELTFTPTTGFKYAKMYRHFRRLKYVKQEAVELLKKFGLTHMTKILPAMTDKIGIRAIQTRIDKLDEYQIAFSLTAAEIARCHEALAVMGASKTDAGRYYNSSSAFMHMVDKVLGYQLKKAA